MAKKKITAGMLGGRKKKTPEDIEKAVQSIHQKEESPTLSFESVANHIPKIEKDENPIVKSVQTSKPKKAKT